MDLALDTILKFLVEKFDKSESYLTKVLISLGILITLLCFCIFILTILIEYSIIG